MNNLYFSHSKQSEEGEKEATSPPPPLSLSFLILSVCAWTYFDWQITARHLIIIYLNLYKKTKTCIETDSCALTTYVESFCGCVFNLSCIYLFIFPPNDLPVIYRGSNLSKAALVRRGCVEYYLKQYFSHVAHVVNIQLKKNQMGENAEDAKAGLHCRVRHGCCCCKRCLVDDDDAPLMQIYQTQPAFSQLNHPELLHQVKITEKYTIKNQKKILPSLFPCCWQKMHKK